MATFQAQVDAWVRKSQARMLAIFRLSSQYMIEAVLDRTPVDTGYLRASLVITYDGPVPMRADARSSGDWSYDPPLYSLQIAASSLGDTLYASFTAAYARRIEYGFQGADSLGRQYNQEGVGMVRLAAQRWQEFVDRSTAEAKARVKSA